MLPALHGRLPPLVSNHQVDVLELVVQLFIFLVLYTRPHFSGEQPLEHLVALFLGFPNRQSLLRALFLRFNYYMLFFDSVWHRWLQNLVFVIRLEFSLRPLYYINFFQDC